jgi:hypothetical protein
MTEHEEILSGGNISEVVRIGATVRRALRPWSPAVHGLLRHLEARGFDGVPRFLGVDSQNREVLTFIPGEVGAYPLPRYMWSDEVLIATAVLLRRFHDATVGYIAPPDAPWQLVHPDATRHEVICHNDVAPYNLVFVDERPRALIDFDTAGPGPRLWDIAYAAYRLVPLTDDDDTRALGLTAPAMRGRRLRLFCDTYGLTDRHDLLETVERRLEALCALMVGRAAGGDAAYQRLLAEGHLAHYEREIAFLRDHRQELQHYVQ